MIRFRRGLLAAVGILAVLASAGLRARAAEPQALKIHDTVVVTVKEKSQPNEKLGFNPEPNGSSVTDGILTYYVTATVVNVRADGMLLLEAHESIRDDKRAWEYSLTGAIGPADISPERTASSEHIADLSISKVQHGKPRGSSSGHWFTELGRRVGLFEGQRAAETP